MVTEWSHDATRVSPDLFNRQIRGFSGSDHPMVLAKPNQTDSNSVQPCPKQIIRTQTIAIHSPSNLSDWWFQPL